MMKGFFAIGNFSNLLVFFSFQGDPIALASYDIPSFCKMIGNDGRLMYMSPPSLNTRVS